MPPASPDAAYCATDGGKTAAGFPNFYGFGLNTGGSVLTAQFSRDSLMPMALGRQIRRQAKYIIGPVIGLSLSGYFAYHMVEGDRGLGAWIRLTQLIREAKAQQAQVHAEREAAEQRVSQLRPEHLDPDRLDEEARSTLNLVGPNEIVILKSTPTK